MFIATPHRGSNLAESLGKILKVCFSSKQYVADLRRDSPMLESLNEEFRHIAPKLQIFSFYETAETPVASSAVKEVSCIPAHNGRVELTHLDGT